MRKREYFVHWIKENIVYIGSFALPFLIMTSICIICGVEPFGDQTFAIIDGLHQYMPFFGEYYEKLRDMDSLFYSWNGGLGHNFWSLWAYYLSSPLNLLLVFLPKTALPMGFSWLMVLKIALTGLTSATFFIHRSNKKNWKAILFSTAFALSNYMIGYSWNAMWLDGILMFPLVLLGFDKLMKEKDGKWYALCLALAMVGNYYIAFMICLFLILWFFLYEHKNVGDFINNGIGFALYSLLGACMAAVVLLPAYFGLMNTASAGAMALPEHEWLTNWANIFVTHLAGTEPITNNNFDGNANLYVGMFSLLLSFLYLFGKGIRWQDKIKRILLLAVLGISLNEKILNFIWHGMHDQYGIPNRFAFLYLFLIVFTGFEAFEKIKEMGPIHVLPAIISTALAVGLVSYYADGEVEYLILGISLGLIILYGIMLLLYSGRKISYKLCTYAVAAFVFMETIGASAYGFMCNGQVDVPKFFDDTKGIEVLMETVPEEELVRTELVSAKMLDEAVWHNLKSVGMFGSTVNGTTVSMMDHLGFFTGANEYLYKGATPLTNVLLNVQYNIRRDSDTKRNQFQIVDIYEDMELLKNPYETSIGYGIEGTLEEWNYESVYPFRVQNRFVEQAYGMEGLFLEKEIPEPRTNDCEVEATQSSGEYRIEYGESYSDNITFSIPVEEGDDIYLHYDGSRVEKAVVTVGDEVRVSKKINSEIFHVGLIEGQSEVIVQFQLKNDGLKTGVVRLSVASFDNESFEELHKKMINHAVKVDSYTSNTLEGTIQMEEDGLILFSIPYDTGWTIWINGEEEESFPVADGLLAVPVKAGEWNLCMEFIPGGWQEGFILTMAGTGFFVALAFFEKRKKNYYNKK